MFLLSCLKPCHYPETTGLLVLFERLTASPCVCLSVRPACPLSVRPPSRLLSLPLFQSSRSAPPPPNHLITSPYLPLNLMHSWSAACILRPLSSSCLKLPEHVKTPTDSNAPRSRSFAPSYLHTHTHQQHPSKTSHSWSRAYMMRPNIRVTCKTCNETSWKTIMGCCSLGGGTAWF